MKKTTKEFLKAALPVAMILSASWNASASLSSIKTDEASIRKDQECLAPEFSEADESDVFLTAGCATACYINCSGGCHSGCKTGCQGGCARVNYHGNNLF